MKGRRQGTRAKARAEPSDSRAADGLWVRRRDACGHRFLAHRAPIGHGEALGRLAHTAAVG